MSDLGFCDGTLISMYADDILLWKPIKCSNDYVYLQTDINNISNYIRSLYLSLNSSKCKYIIASRKRQPTLPSSGLHLNGEALEHVRSYQYLGIPVTETLTWSHTASVLKGKKANWNDVQAILLLGKHICSSIHIHNVYSPSLGVCSCSRY